MASTQKVQSNAMNFSSVTSNELGKISQNFLKLASAFSDDEDSDLDMQDYFSSYMNMSQSPEESHKKQARGPPSTCTKKSILKKSGSNNFATAFVPERHSAQPTIPQSEQSKKQRKGSELLLGLTKTS